MCSGPGTYTGSGTGNAGQQADQVSLYNPQICCPRFLTSPNGHGKS